MSAMKQLCLFLGCQTLQLKKKLNSWEATGQGIKLLCFTIVVPLIVLNKIRAMERRSKDFLTIALFVLY